MIKSELIQRIAARNPHLYRRDVEAVIDVILGRIADGVLAGGRVELRGFGTLSAKARGARVGRNPKTGVQVSVAEKRALAFKPGRACGLA